MQNNKQNKCLTLKEWLIKNRYSLLFYGLLLAWFLLNIFQAVYTEITEDEAYYYLYAKKLSWGYYDHPPILAVGIYLGSLLFKGNLAVRFFTILLQVFSLILLSKILSEGKETKRNIFVFFLVFFSFVMLSAYGFIAGPDSPLLFFTTLFLFAYQRYLKECSLSSAILLSVSMAGLMYSKYQAVLLIGFVILSNWKLLKDKRFLLAIAIAIFLYIPHLYWQFSHHFPSLKYHLLARSRPFHIIYFLEYIPNQLLVFNPFTFILAIWAVVKFPIKGVYERALLFVSIGTILFFWLSTFRGHAEPHWTVLCTIPIGILLCRRALVHPSVRKKLYYWVLPSLVLILIARFLLVSVCLPEKLGFSGKQEKMEKIHSSAGDLPVVFSGSFQKPSLYSYFIGKRATVISSLQSRMSQFDIWQFDRDLQGKEVFVAIPNQNPNANSSASCTDMGFITKHLQTTNRIEIDYELEQKDFMQGDSIRLNLSIRNPYAVLFDFNHKEFPAKLNVFFVQGQDLILLEKLNLSDTLTVLGVGEATQRSISFCLPDNLKPEKAHFGISLSSFFNNSLNSPLTTIHIHAKK